MDEFASRGYPVNEDMRFQRRSWVVERAGWLVLAAITLAGLSGIFGNGPASWQRITAGPLTVEYERFQRATRTSAFVFTITAAEGAESVLRLGAPFQKAFEISSIEPRPLRSRAGPDGLALTFAAKAGAPSQIVIWARSRRYGLSAITAAADGSAPLSSWVFVYP